MKAYERGYNAGFAAGYKLGKPVGRQQAMLDEMRREFPKRIAEIRKRIERIEGKAA